MILPLVSWTVYSYSFELRLYNSQASKIATLTRTRCLKYIHPDKNLSFKMGRKASTEAKETHPQLVNICLKNA